MFRRIVMLTLVKDTRDEDRAALIEGLRELQSVVPQIQGFAVVENCLPEAGGADIAVLADFDSAEDWRGYVDHPAHQRVVTQLLRPIVESRDAIQYAELRT